VWSEAHMLDVVNRFPRSYGPALLYAQQAHGRRDFEEAARRYRVAINCDPRDIRAYMGAALALREAGRFDEAEALLLQARRRFRSAQPVYVDLAVIAHERQDWPEAVRRWEALRKRFPMAEVGYTLGADSLRNAGRAADADAVLAEAAARFPAPASATAADC